MGCGALSFGLLGSPWPIALARAATTASQLCWLLHTTSTESELIPTVGNLPVITYALFAFFKLLPPCFLAVAAWGSSSSGHPLQFG